MIRLIIARHGATTENELNICQGQEQGTLSEKGITENKELGKQLKQFPFQIIYSSPLHRALQTARAIHEHNSESRIITDNRLMERNLGVLQGKVYPPNYSESDLYEGMETIEAVAKRSASFLHEMASNHSNETIVLVSHGYIIKVMLSLIRGLPLYDFYKINLLQNSSYLIETAHQFP
ncbi:MAG TPA: histidine phosphatase family protein [Chitinophagaceae bacterium]|nr:histidine phosphatase family protein [Chitinophagaceae bacterium]